MMIVEGYGPEDLIMAVRSSIWLPSSPNGEHFTGIDFKGHLLMTVPDSYYPQKYRAIFFEVPRGSGDEFILDGYQIEQLLEHLNKVSVIPVSFGDHSVILSSINNLYDKAYRLLLENI